MADENSYSRKRRSPSVEVIIKLNGENASDPQCPIIENADPKAKVARKDNLAEDNDSNLYHDLSQNSVETNVSVQEKILELQDENMKLKRQLQEVNSKLCKCNLKLDKETEDVLDGQDRPLISIKFFDEDTADLYRSKFQRFLESFVELTFSNEHLEINILKNTNSISCAVQPDTTSPETNKAKRKRKKSKTEAAKEIFVLDTTPSLITKGNGNLKYISKYTVPAVGIEDEKDGEIKKETCFQTCFNCDGNHALRDCSEPKDFAKIHVARQKLKSQNIKVRYHLEEEQKFSHLAPGKISQNLKTALGIRNNQLPEYIYRMRVIGYPPGWMKEAQVIHSDISLYDIEGKNIRCSKRNKQESVDPDKVVEYAGFNMPIEKDTKDDYDRYKCPPYSEKCSKLAMLDFINKMEEKEKDNLETCDMEIDLPTDEELVPPGCELPKENDKLLERLSPSLVELEKKKLELLAALDDGATNSSSGGDENLNVVVNSTKLREIILANNGNRKATEKQTEEFIDSGTTKTENTNLSQTVEINYPEESEKVNISEGITEMKPLQEIGLQTTNKEEDKEAKNMNNDAIELDMPRDAVNDAIELDMPRDAVNDIINVEETVPQMQETIETESENNVTTTESFPPETPVNNVKKSSFGTPILKSASPYSSLPNPENFSKGVSPVINFENLPNSTGKYKQMATVLFKVRRTLKSVTDRS